MLAASLQHRPVFFDYASQDIGVLLFDALSEQHPEQPAENQPKNESTEHSRSSVSGCGPGLIPAVWSQIGGRVAPNLSRQKVCVSIHAAATTALLP